MNLDLLSAFLDANKNGNPENVYKSLIRALNYNGNSPKRALKALFLMHYHIQEIGRAFCNILERDYELFDRSKIGTTLSISDS